MVTSIVQHFWEDFSWYSSFSVVWYVLIFEFLRRKNWNFYFQLQIFEYFKYIVTGNVRQLHTGNSRPDWFKAEIRR